jgi:hypothetical protein
MDRINRIYRMKKEADWPAYCTAPFGEHSFIAKFILFIL